MKIYFAGSVRGGRQDAKYYAAILDFLRGFGEVLTEHVGDTGLSEEGDDGPDDCFIHDRDMAWLKACDLVVAEVTSFKIEGRYKEMDYVKNVTAAYRLALYHLIAEQPKNCRAAGRICDFDFQPDPERTFNRGYTTYFLSDEREKIASMNTPKSMGQFIGRVKAVGRVFYPSAF